MPVTQIIRDNDRVAGLRDHNWGGPVTIYDAKTMKIKGYIENPLSYDDVKNTRAELYRKNVLKNRKAVPNRKGRRGIE